MFAKTVANKYPSTVENWTELADKTASKTKFQKLKKLPTVEYLRHVCFWYIHLNLRWH